MSTFGDTSWLSPLPPEFQRDNWPHIRCCVTVQLVVRAQQFLWSHCDTFEKTRGGGYNPWLWRLTSATKRRYGYTFKSIAGYTQRRDHWLGLGWLWLTLTYAGGHPQKWTTEHFTWNGKRVLAEYQRSIISSKKWREKWYKRFAWYDAQKFDDKPYVLLVVMTDQTQRLMHRQAQSSAVALMTYIDLDVSSN